MSTLTNLEIIKAIPHSMRLDNRLESGIQSRTNRTWSASNDIYSPTGISTASITVPPFGWTQQSCNRFVGVLSWTGDSTTELTGSVHSLFRRVKLISSNGQVLFDCDQYDVIASVLQDTTLSLSQQQGILGITSLMQDDIRKLGNGVQFSFQPLISMLRSERITPQHLLGGYTVEFYLQDAKTCFKSAVPVSYQISRLRNTTDVLVFDEATEQKYKAAWEQNKLKYFYEAWRAYPSMSQSQVATLKVESGNNSLDSLIVAPRVASRIVDQSVNSYERTQGSLFNVDIQVGTNKFQTMDLSYGNAEGLGELEMVLDSSMQSTITPVDWSSYYGNNPKKFVIAKNLNMLSDPSTLAGSRGHIQIDLKHSAALASPIQYTTFVLHNICVVSGRDTGTMVLS